MTEPTAEALTERVNFRCTKTMVDDVSAMARKVRKATGEDIGESDVLRAAVEQGLPLVLAAAKKAGA